MNRDIGFKIKKIRKAKRMSQSELSRRAGIAQSTLSYIENGKKTPQFETLSSICNGLDISVLTLLTYQEKKTTTKLFEQTQATYAHEQAVMHLPPEAMQELYEFEGYLMRKYGLLEES